MIVSLWHPFIFRSGSEAANPTRTTGVKQLPGKVNPTNIADIRCLAQSGRFDIIRTNDRPSNRRSNGPSWRGNAWYISKHVLKIAIFQDVTNGLCFSDKPLKLSSAASAIKAIDIPANSQTVQLTASPQAVMSRLPSTDENSSALVLYCIACCALSVKHNWLKVDDFDFYYIRITAKRSRTGLFSLHVLFWR